MIFYFCDFFKRQNDILIRDKKFYRIRKVRIYNFRNIEIIIQNTGAFLEPRRGVEARRIMRQSG